MKFFKKKQETPPSTKLFTIQVGNGYINVEAPTKQEALEIFNEVAKIKHKSAINEAIR